MTLFGVSCIFYCKLTHAHRKKTDSTEKNDRIQINSTKKSSIHKVNNEKITFFFMMFFFMFVDVIFLALSLNFWFTIWYTHLVNTRNV